MKKAMADPEDLDLDILAESELARLQRQYRIMEGDRRAFLEEMNTKLAKQMAIIQTLRNEHSQLLADLNIATTKNKKKQDQIDSIGIEKLYQSFLETSNRLDGRKNELRSVSLAVMQKEKELEQLISKDVTENQFRSKMNTKKQFIEILETRLETSIKRFCTVLSENKNLRDDLEHLLKERTVYNLISKKLVKELELTNKITLDMVDKATNAYDKRDEWCNKLHSIKWKDQNAQLEHSQEISTIQKDIENDEKLKDFLSIKAQRRIMKDLEIKEQQKKEQIQAQENSVIHLYETTLKKIQEFCGEENVNKIVAKFLKQEEENFALFNYVNELNHEVECLKNELEDLNEKLDEMKNDRPQIRNDQEESDENSVIQMRITNMQKEVDKNKSIMLETEKRLNDILKVIEEIYKLLKCDSESSITLLSNSKNLNVSNVMVHLSLIEQKINKMTSEKTSSENL